MEPVTLSIADAMKAIGIGRTKIYELIGAKKLRAVRLGGRTLVRTDSIRALVDSLSEAA
jgi:excisionase family DNA binding protein